MNVLKCILVQKVVFFKYKRGRYVSQRHRVLGSIYSGYRDDPIHHHVPGSISDGDRDTVRHQVQPAGAPLKSRIGWNPEMHAAT